jgi:hypothetical protein
LVRQWRIAIAMRSLDLTGGNELKRIRRHKLLIWDYLWECHSSDDPDLRRGN